MMDLGLFCTYNAPASLRFHAAHGGHSLGHAISKPVAMRYLVKTVRRKDGTDWDRFKENIERAGHRSILSFSIIPFYDSARQMTFRFGYYFNSSGITSSISFLTWRKTCFCSSRVPCALAGSTKLWWMRFPAFPGQTGHSSAAESQTVTTTSKSFVGKSLICFDEPECEMPISLNASFASS